MRRFFFRPQQKRDTLVTLDREESQHATRVLRLRSGDEIELFDGSGTLYCGRIEDTQRQVSVRLLAETTMAEEQIPALWVCQGDLKGKKMDLVVQKCTELGVARFLPFTSSRSQGRSATERQERKQERWQKLVESACKQSGRLRLMEVEQERCFADLLAAVGTTAADLKILFWEEERQRRLADVDWRRPGERICLLLGPEGGFSAEETEAARQQGWQLVTLGTQVLRAETATMAAVSIVRHLLGAL